MTITGQSSLAKDDIERMVRDAESHAADDKRRREEAEVRNQGDSLVYQTEKLLRDQGDKVTGEEKTSVESALANLKAALGGSDIDAIKSANDALGVATQALAARMYEQASSTSADSATGGSSTGDGGDDSTIADAEIVDAE